MYSHDIYSKYTKIKKTNLHKSIHKYLMWNTYKLLWSTKPVIIIMGIFVAIANNKLYGQNYLFFFFLSKIIRILSKD